MQLSVVIVNYNVRYFLEQALRSVERAIEDVEAEVFVVDNNSADDSVAMVRQHFPWVRLIARSDNPGFSVANNQAISQSGGEYILLLNPDTVVCEDTFRICLDFMDQQPKAGGLGVRMIDGSGRFLPESKRGLPTPWVAFCKAFGLSRLFPNSKKYNHYHLGYLSEEESNRVEVLSGAYMFMRRQTLEEVGLLDERFFMYGEDIDLSYRILLGGWENWYLPTTSIIHYKGESTKRGSLNYVRTFYQAMILFARKHFVGSAQRSLILGMKVAIYLRAALTLVGNFWGRWRLPLLDASGVYLGLVLLKSVWAQYHFGDPNYYDQRILWLHFPAYTAMWMSGIFLAGSYDRPKETLRLFRGLGISTLILLAIYGLLPALFRPSRALLLLGAAWAGIWTLAMRFAWVLSNKGTLDLSPDRPAQLIIIGSDRESERTLSLLRKAGAKHNLLTRFDPSAAELSLQETVELYRPNELIFCSADLSHQRIQEWMMALGPQLRYRILADRADTIIGSHHKGRRGVLYTIEPYLRLAEPVQRRSKRLFDLSLAALIILTCPFSIWIANRPIPFFSHAVQVLLGRKTWVGYAGLPDDRDKLPPLPPAVIHLSVPADQALSDPIIQELNQLYARDYRVRTDWNLIWKHRKQLGG
ncbi:MAG: glycosyltransferase [Bacteroidota bacterium]